MNLDHVIHMDRTQIPFFYCNNHMWSKKGLQTIHLRASTSETKQTMLAAIVMMSYQMSIAVLIFKSRQNGRITKKR